MQRSAFLVYGVFCHALFLVVFLYMAGFVGNVGVPKSIDSAPAAAPWAALIDAALLALFAVPHSVMARPGFKRWWTRWVPEPIERSTYVLIACLCTGVLMWQWRSLPAVVWDVQPLLARTLVWGIFAGGWFLVPLASFMISHFDLFGTRQVWLHVRRQAYTSLPFRTPGLYRHVRHPLYVGWFIALWATPTMTVGHLLLAASLTLYIIIAVSYEERDLTAAYPEAYPAYRREVPMFVPRLRSGASSPSEASADAATP
jgi:protein-S-isoprenylcysteine O-methyltransferase Ste14